jgi:excinuclease ABC subunit C
MIKTSAPASIPYKKFPETPGVYIMKDAAGRVLYVGKAGNLRRRVSSYFERPHDVRIQTLVSKIARIDFEQKETALEALIREAELIKKITPPFNVREKDDKSFLYFEITREKFPRVLLVRGAGVVEGKSGAHTSGNVSQGKRFGPFTSASSAREALRILRRIFPWSTHDPDEIGRMKRPCFNYEIGLCPGTCVGAITHEEYIKNIDRLTLFFEGKKVRIIRALEKEMRAMAKKQEFERAAAFRRQIFALRHIQDTALISDNEVLMTRGAGVGISGGATGPTLKDGYRIEGYDISNISGTSAVGSMVVFEDGAPNKNDYRKFKIKSIFQPNDVGMLKEVLERRFAHATPVDGRAATKSQWPMPDLVLIDGGLAQVNTARRVLLRAGITVPIVGIAKGPRRDHNDIIGLVPKGVQKITLIKVRDEAHRFAIGYHKSLRAREFIKK